MSLPQYKPVALPFRILLMAVGTVSLGLGILGAFLPGLPTTVFLIITTFCYARSSKTLYDWFLSRKWLEKPLSVMVDFFENKRVPLKVKWIANVSAWTSVALLLYFKGVSVAFWIALSLAVACTAFMLWVDTTEA
jgi:uncharacterized protein